MKRNIFLIILSIFLFSCSDESSIQGDAYFKKGEFQKAIEAYSDYLALNPNNIKALYNRGRAYEELGEYEKALEDFNAVLSNDDNHVQAKLSIAKNYYERELYDDTIYRCDLVLDQFPHNSQAYLLKGQAHQRKGELKEAMDSYNQAISYNKDFGEAYLNRGILRVYLKQRTSACNDFKLSEALGVEAAKKARNQYCK